MLALLGRQAILGLVLLIAACGSTQTAVRTSPSPPGPAASSVPPPSPAPSAPPPAATVKISDSRYGQILVDASGRTLYLFDAESGPQPRCYGQCAGAWPPFTATAEAVAGPGLAANLLSTATRADGSTQVTYNGHPLYHYVGDRAPGEILCQAVIEYGGGWYVVDPRGDRITSR